MPWINSDGEFASSYAHILPSGLLVDQRRDLEDRGYRWISVERYHLDPCRAWEEADLVYQQDRSVREHLAALEDRTGLQRTRTILALAVRNGHAVWVNRHGRVHPISDPGLSRSMQQEIYDNGFLPVFPPDESVTEFRLSVLWDDVAQRSNLDYDYVQRWIVREEGRPCYSVAGLRLPRIGVRNATVEVAEILPPWLRERQRADQMERDAATSAASAARLAEQRARRSAPVAVVPASEPGDADDDLHPGDRPSQSNVSRADREIVVCFGRVEVVDERQRTREGWERVLTQVERALLAVPVPRGQAPEQVSEIAYMRYALCGLFRLAYDRLAHLQETS